MLLGSQGTLKKLLETCNFTQDGKYSFSMSYEPSTQNV
jgi:hypothetical protein